LVVLKCSWLGCCTPLRLIIMIMLKYT
jgi:hypothetical protein